jgi:hypothetical protein
MKLPPIRLTVRLVMALILALGGTLAWVAHGARVQRDAVAAVERGGGRVKYGWDSRIPRDRSLAKMKATGRPSAPKWLVDSLGVDYFGDVKNVYLGPERPDEVMASVGRLSGLEQLSTFAGAELTAVGLAHLRRSDRLWRVDLASSKLTGEGLKILCGLPNIRFLNVSHQSDICDDDMAHLGRLKDLESLALGCPRVTDAGITHLRPLVALTTLDIGPCAMTSVGLTSLGGLTRLDHLRLRNTRVDDLGPIRGLKSLVELFVNGSLVGDEGLAPVADIATLKRLSVIDSPVGDPGLEHLQGLSKLTDLNLSRTRITDAGLRPLGGLQSLTRLTVTGTGVTDTGVAALKKALPKIRVVR